jgi:hypothetical protein
MATPNAKADSILAKPDFLCRRPFHDLVRAHFGAYPASAASMGIDSMIHGSSFGKGADFYFFNRLSIFRLPKYHDFHPKIHSLPHPFLIFLPAE